MSDNSSIEETIFLGARSLTHPLERAAYLDQKCGGDAVLRERVERLLSAEQRADQFLAGGPMQLNTMAIPPVLPDETVGALIGPYKVLQQIGEGGCGLVYMAEQEQPIRRRVALKVIKPGMDTRQVIARFEAERQALAMMDHPNIARVLDAGTTENGRPYFVMELVRGVRITEYCDQNNLSTRDRLDLFTKVVHAVQHAHQKGIIHRDLKPSNVLITLHDGVPVPKVIDFGIAKALEQKLTDKTLFTQFEQFMGTPAYTSPEQAEMSGLDIDTRSDIYSLGVLLYELLVGKTPFDAHDLIHSGLDAMRRIIREQEPARPSTRLGTMGAGEVTTTAQRRRVSAPELVHLLKGDLDWIVMKCLEKDRTRRYATATGLAEDIQNYLGNEPVSARPPSQVYRFSKLVRRNKLAFAAGAAVAVALVAGIAVSTWQAVRAHRAEQVAKEEKESAEAVLQFVRDKVLAAGRPEGQGGGLGQDVSLRQAIDAAEAEIGKRFTNRPLVEAAIRKTIGESYRYLGEPGLAVDQLERAFALRRQELGLADERTLSVLNALKEACKADGKPDRVLPLYEGFIKLRKATSGLEDPVTLAAMNDLGRAYADAGKHEQAQRLLEETLEIRKAILEPGHEATLTSMNNLALQYMHLKKADQAVPLFEETVRLRKAKLGADHHLTVLTKRNLVAALGMVGKHDQALALAKETLELTRAKLGAEHLDTLYQMQALAFALGDHGRLDEAVPLFEEVIKGRTAKLGAEHPDTLYSLNALAYYFEKAGKNEQALSLYEESLKLRKVKFGPDHPNTLVAMNNLGLAYSEAGKAEQGVILLEETLRLRKAKLGNEHPHTLTTMNNLALAYGGLGKLDRGVKLFEETLELMRASLGADHGGTLNTMNNLAVAYGKAGKLDQSLSLAQEVMDITKTKRGPEHPKTLKMMNELGGALSRAGKHDEAVSLLEKTLELQTAKLGREHPDTLSTAHRLGDAALGAEKYDLALPLLQEAFLRLKTKRGPDHFDTLLTMQSLAIATEFTSSGTLEQALPLYEETFRRMKGTDHGETLLAMNNLAGAYVAAGTFDAALALLEETLKLRKAKLGPEHPDTLRTLTDFAELHHRQHQYAEAQRLYREVLLSRRARLGAEHKDVIASLASLGRLLADWAWAERDSKSGVQNPKPEVVERVREAERLLRESLGFHLRGTNQTHWRVADVKSRLGAALVSVAVTDPALDATTREAKLAEAETLLLQGHQRLQESQSADKKYKRDALKRLTRLYEAWDKLDQLSEWRQKLGEFDPPKAHSPTPTEQAKE